MSKRAISSSSDGTESDTNSEDEVSSANFLCAVRSNDYDKVVDFLSKVNLVEAGNLVNSKDLNAKEDSPLHVAVRNLMKSTGNKNWHDVKKSENIINLLVQHQANVSYRNLSKKTALDLVRKKIPYDVGLHNLLSSTKHFTSSQSSAPANKRAKRPLETYAASGLKFSLHGTIFQLQLLMLYMHRGVANFNIFDLATEMDQAEKFDDIVVRYKNDPADSWHWSFLQAKHKNNPQLDRVTLKDFIMVEDGIFSLTKYFISFCKIRANPTFEDGILDDFILCTNTTLDDTSRHKRKQGEPCNDQKDEFVDKWANHLACSALSAPSILFCPNSKVETAVYRFKDDAYKDVETLVKSAFLNISKASELITDFKHIASTLEVLEQQMVLSGVLKSIREFASGSKLNQKEYIKANANKILKHREKLPQIDFRKLQAALGALKGHSGRGGDIQKANVSAAVNDLKQNANNALDKCNSFMDLLNDNCSAEFVAVNADVAQLLNLRKMFTTLRADILKCATVADLKALLSNEIPVLANLAKDASLELEKGKRKAQKSLDTLISEMVMVETACSPPKFRQLLQEFLEKFQLVVNYPDVEQLNLLLKIEFGEQFCLLDANLLADSFERHMLEWFMEYNNGRTTFFSSDRGNSFFKSLHQSLASLMTSGLNKAYLDKLNSYNISFHHSNDFFRHFLQSDGHILQITSTSTRLSTMKVLQEVKKIEKFAYQDSFICVRLKSLFRPQIRKLVCDAFSIQDKFFLMIVECQDGSLSDIGFRYACEGLLIEGLKEKKLIFVTANDDLVFGELSALTCLEVVRFVDETKFEHLSPTSQQALLHRSLILQNETVALDELLDIKSASAVIDKVSLRYLVEQKTIEIGDTRAFFSFGYNSECYIERCLQQQKLTAEVFKVVGSVFLVTGASKEALIALSIPNTVSDWGPGSKYSSGSIVLPPSAEADAKQIFQDLVLHNYPASHVTWIRCQQATFFWEAFTGNHLDIDRCIDMTYDFQVKNEETFATPRLTQKVVVVVNDPGMGKSTYITSLSRKMKKRFKNFWIIRINFNEHAFRRQWLTNIDNRRFTKSLNELPEVIDSDFIYDLAMWPSGAHELEVFQRKLFKLALDGHGSGRTPKLVFFFDGFDEVCPTYEKQAIKILQMLENSAAIQVWITTRIQQKKVLESKFCPAHVLSKLTKDDQTWFLDRFWRQRIVANVHELEEKQELDNVLLYLQEVGSNLLQHADDHQGTFAEIMQLQLYHAETIGNLIEQLDLKAVAIFFVEQWNVAIRDSAKAFIDIPLQVSMLGEIVVNQNFRLPENIGLTHLFDTFVQNKINIYFYGKSVFVGNVLSDEVSEDQSKYLRQDHSVLALNLLFPDRNWSRPERTPQLLARAGLLILQSDTRFHFIHRSFAEFFVADLIVKKLRSEEFQSLLLKTIFVYGQHFLIAAFLDEMLIHYPKVQLSRHLLEDILESTHHKDTFLHNIVAMGSSTIMKFFIEQLYDYPDIFDQLLVKTGTYGTIPLYGVIYDPRLQQQQQKINFSASKIHVIEEFLSLLKDEHVAKLLTHFYHESLILLNGQTREVTMLQVAILNNSAEVVEVLIKQVIARKLVREVLVKNGFERDGTIFHFCCRLGKVPLMDLLQLLTNEREENLLELKEMLLLPDSQRRTLLHWLAFSSSASSAISQFLDWLKLHMPDAILEFFEYRDQQSLTPVDIAVYKCRTSTMNIFLDFLDKNLPGKLQEMLSGQFHESLLNKSICQGKHQSVKALMGWFQRCQRQDFKDQLLNPASVADRRTSLTLAAARNFPETLQMVFTCLEELLPEHNSSTLIAMLLQHRDSDGKNILHEAVFWKRSGVVRALGDFIKTKCNFETELRVLFAADKWGKVAFDYADRALDIEQALTEIYQSVIEQIRFSSKDVTLISRHFTNDSLNWIETFVNQHCTDCSAILEALKKIRCAVVIESTPTEQSESSKPLLLGLPE